jgi:hypothetical protein
MSPSYKSFTRGDIVPLIKLIEEFLRWRARCIESADETSLERIIEVLWFKEAQCVPQLSLVVDPAKSRRKGCFGFVDLFVGDPTQESCRTIGVFELEHIELLAIWGATQRTKKTELSSPEAYDQLLTILRHASDDELLDQTFSFYDKHQNKRKTSKVRNVLHRATIRLRNYLEVISSGQAAYDQKGLIDRRVLCRPGLDRLRGYVIICVGGLRVICREVEMRITAHSFQVQSWKVTA